MKFQVSREEMVESMRKGLREVLHLEMVESMRAGLREALRLELPSLGKDSFPLGKDGLRAETANIVHELKEDIRKLHSHWLTRRDAAAYCKCSPSHVDDLARTKQITRFEGSLYHRLDLDKCIQQGRFTVNKADLARAKTEQLFQERRDIIAKRTAAAAGKGALL